MSHTTPATKKTAPKMLTFGASSTQRSVTNAHARARPFACLQGFDDALGRRLLGRNRGQHSDLTQRSRWLWPSRCRPHVSQRRNRLGLDP